jgi:hypothetical protein
MSELRPMCMRSESDDGPCAVCDRRHPPTALQATEPRASASGFMESHHRRGVQRNDFTKHQLAPNLVTEEQVADVSAAEIARAELRTRSLRSCLEEGPDGCGDQ